jgi:hypothetical protein
MNVLVRIGIIKNETLVYGQKDLITFITINKLNILTTFWVTAFDTKICNHRARCLTTRNQIYTKMT